MKNYFKYLLLLFFCILVMPMAAKAAENDNLKIEKDKVAVSVNIPEGKTETITSLRMKLLVTLNSGSMGEPVFAFEDAVKSTVKDVSISNKGDNCYTIDLVLSGKKEQNIFGNSEYVKLGNLSLQPSSEQFEIEVEILGEDDNREEPVVTYVDAGGLSAVTVPLTDGSLILTEKNYLGSNQEEPVKSSFNKNKKMNLSTSVRTGEKRVTFTWQKVKGADGYILYQYDAKKKKYISLKKFTDAGITTYSKNYAYGSNCSFKIQAYRTEKDGSITYGKYSAVVKAKVDLAKVEGFSAGYQSKSKAALSWSKVSGAKGYQIYRSSKKTGKYKLVKTIKKGTTLSCNIKHPKGTVYYYKIRAYTAGADGQRVYGKYSAVKSAVPKAPKLRVKKNSAKVVILSWNKVARAEGYYIYRSSSKSGKYVRIKTVENVSETSITGKGAAKYYYKICAFEKQDGKEQKGAYSSAVKAK